MARVQTIDFRKFVRDEWRSPNEIKVLKIVALGGNLFAVFAPRTVVAATADATFGNVWSAVMNVVDWIAVGVFIFAGVSWMFGHRTKALEYVIGGSVGYILARHAIDLRDFLKGI
ncbi:glycosyltransferase [Bacillus sp. JJ1503]|uniref:glycosyltransferase n=1 Tax=Bacillus sp. JJ1503 TaxID=3122956 RepID=UPI002FFF346A